MYCEKWQFKTLVLFLPIFVADTKMIFQLQFLSSFNDANNSQYTQWYIMSLDISDFKILKPPTSTKKNYTT